MVANVSDTQMSKKAVDFSVTCTQCEMGTGNHYTDCSGGIPKKCCIYSMQGEESQSHVIEYSA
jgi:hypothetical protein